MRLRTLLSLIAAASRAADADIRAFAKRGRIAAGMASESYAGGYYDALQDVLLAMHGVKPDRRRWWPDSPHWEG